MDNYNSSSLPYNGRVDPNKPYFTKQNKKIDQSVTLKKYVFHET